MYKKHPYEERLLAVQKCLEGYAPKHVARELGIDWHDVSEWLVRYEKEGALGLQIKSHFYVQKMHFFLHLLCEI